MNIICLDLEGVLVPEIWVELAKRTGIKELERTTKEEPDYDKLMKWRLDILNKNGITIDKIKDVIADISPMDGAKEFLDKLRNRTQVVILSDTFEEFAMPILKKLGNPTILCNSLIVSKEGKIEGYRMHCKETKLSTVKALQSIGYDTIASGDSYNDLGMIKQSKAGFLFKTTGKIKSENPNVKTCESYDELFDNILKCL